MWSQPEASTEAWETALTKEAGEYDAAVITATGNVLCAARKFHEIFVGGDDTPCLIQILSALADDAAEGDRKDGTVDVIASVLLPEEDVKIAYTARGKDATRLIASFWSTQRKSPALLQHNGTFHRVMCKLPEGNWTEGFLCPAHIQKLQNSSIAEAGEAEALYVYVPGEQSASVEKERAAIARPHECRLEFS